MKRRMTSVPTEPTELQRVLGGYQLPCGHEPPQGAAQLHGVCLFCYRDRLGSAHRLLHELAADFERAAQVAMLSDRITAGQEGEIGAARERWRLK